MRTRFDRGDGGITVRRMWRTYDCCFDTRRGDHFSDIAKALDAVFLAVLLCLFPATAVDSDEFHFG